MSSAATPAIILRRLDHGDYDLILNLFTRNYGKITVIAKSAKKSVKRFGGVLELFSELEVVYTKGRGRLPILQEASLRQPFAAIRTNIQKTAYASYWAELINTWSEEGSAQDPIYRLFRQVLKAMDQSLIQDEALSVLFQLKFMDHSGFSPNLLGCSRCGRTVDQMPGPRVRFDLLKGALICETCPPTGAARQVMLSKGTLKQLQWARKGDLNTAFRIRFSSTALTEARDLMEAFVPIHLEKEPKSLTFLKKIR